MEWGKTATNMLFALYTEVTCLMAAIADPRGRQWQIQRYFLLFIVFLKFFLALSRVKSKSFHARALLCRNGKQLK